MSNKKSKKDKKTESKTILKDIIETYYILSGSSKSIKRK
jgi:hypothetical protein